MAKSIGDLFAEPVQPVRAPAGNPLGSLAVLALAVVLAVLAWGKYGSHGESGPVPDGGGSGQVVGKDGFLLFIYERQTPTIDDTQVYDMGAAYCAKQKGLEPRGVDQNDPSKGVREAIAFAETKSVKPPCVVFKDSDKKFVNAVPWPKTEADLVKVFRK